MPHAAAETLSDLESTVVLENVKNKECVVIFILDRMELGPTGLIALLHVMVVPDSDLDLIIVVNQMMFKQSLVALPVSIQLGQSGLVARAVMNSMMNLFLQLELDSMIAQLNLKSKKRLVLHHVVPTGLHGAVGHRAPPAAVMVSPLEHESVLDLMSSVPILAVFLLRLASVKEASAVIIHLNGHHAV